MPRRKRPAAPYYYVRVTGPADMEPLAVSLDSIRLAMDVVRTGDETPLVVYDDPPICLPWGTAREFSNYLIRWAGKQQPCTETVLEIVRVARFALFASVSGGSVNISAPIIAEAA